MKSIVLGTTAALLGLASPGLAYSYDIAGISSSCPAGQALEVYDRKYGAAAPPSTLSNTCYPAPYGMHGLERQYAIHADDLGAMIDKGPGGITYPKYDPTNYDYGDYHTCDESKGDCEGFKASLMECGTWSVAGSADMAFHYWAEAYGAICGISVGDQGRPDDSPVWAALQQNPGAAPGYQVYGVGDVLCGTAPIIKWGTNKAGVARSMDGKYGTLGFRFSLDDIPDGSLGSGSEGPGLQQLFDNAMTGRFYDPTSATDLLEVLGERRKSGCSNPAGGNCKDSFTFVVGSQADWAGQMSPNDVDKLFGKGLGGPGEDANYMSGWMCPNSGGACETRGPFPGLSTPPAFDLNAVWSGSCTPGRNTDCTAPGGCGDPHFMGFDGRPFDFTGVPGASFSVISTPTVQVNAALVPETHEGLTYMGAVGVITPAGRIALTAHPETASVLVEANDAVLPTTAGKVVSLGGGVSLKFVEDGSVKVSVDSVLSFSVSMRHGKFLDIPQVELAMTPTADNIHGVLGQTAVPDRELAGFEGQEEEYVLPSLFSVDSVHNRYMGSDSGVRSISTTLPLSMLGMPGVESGSVLVASATSDL